MLRDAVPEEELGERVERVVVGEPHPHADREALAQERFPDVVAWMFP